MADPEETVPAVPVPVTWDIPVDFPTHYATQVVVQHTADEFTLSFFDIRPPLLIGTPAERQRQIRAIRKIRAIPVARLVVPPARMRELVQVMRDNLRMFEEATSTADGVKP
jgi:hypothetical protein